jgi:hypothetical protein
LVDPAVLIVTNEYDVGTDLVVRELRQRDVPYLRLNTERLSGRCFAWDGAAVRLDGTDLSAVRSVLLRQPVWPPFDSASAPERDVLQNQWRAAVRGLSTLDARWMNPLDAGLAAESKMLQIATARRLGFDVPETLVTNDMEAALAFCERHGGRVAGKGLDAPYVEDPDRPRFVFTTVVTSETLRARPPVDTVPMIFQRLVSPKSDLRVTMAGPAAFGTLIEPGAGVVDWRTDGRNTRLSPCELDPDLVDRCRAFLDTLGLRFGAFDFVISDGRPYFLECNQNGEWGWLQQGTGAPIASAIVSELAAS